MYYQYYQRPIWLVAVRVITVVRLLGRSVGRSAVAVAVVVVVAVAAKCQGWAAPKM